MYKIDKYNIKIDIQLNNGIYIFDNQSSTGKTRLCELLKRYEAYKEPVTSYTYNDKLRGIRIENILIPNKYKVILLDRYDMYEGYGAELINECAKNSIILIDCKDNFTVSNEDEWCEIVMHQDRIEVQQ